uniref:cyclin-T1-4-like n=1 Tax=Fragaria vesca subsp. vesca TaxID=101020 RepID=UPI0005CB629B|nr:PREDICTED: cyclin-T1-4-like [Fragaria vesca subsp. vesca]
MNQWCFSRQALELHSPSRSYDLSEQRVTVVLTYCSYLRQLGSKLRLHHLTIVKATMFCHRFFARQSFAKNDWYTVATACIFLAGKVEDSQRRLKDVVNVAFGNEIQHHIVNQMVRSTINPLDMRERDEFCREKGRVFKDQKRKLIIAAKRLVLKTMQFDLDVQLPYKTLIAALRRLSEEKITGLGSLRLQM